jgi:hypothetical protein
MSDLVAESESFPKDRGLSPKADRERFVRLPLDVTIDHHRFFSNGDVQSAGNFPRIERWAVQTQLMMK